MNLQVVRYPKPNIAPDIYYGRLDMPLQPDRAGVAAVVAAIRARRPVRVPTTPAGRCRTITEFTGLPLRVDPRMQELDFGAWEGIPWDDLPPAALDGKAADSHGFEPSGGESEAALVERVAAVHRDLV